MKCLILAAGYATRLYPLTRDFPKPLLKVQDKTILDWLIDDIDASGKVDQYIVVSNDKFARHFREWAATKSQDIIVLNDGTRTNETRLGAVKDIHYAIETLYIDDDLLVIAGDNLLDFSLKGFIDYALDKKATCTMRYYEKRFAKLQSSGVLTIDDNDKVIRMVEKPERPETHWCCPAFYIYRREDVQLVRTAIQQGCNVDAPGSFIAWLADKSDVYAYEMPGNRYDIGNMKSYQDAQRNYKGVNAE